MARKKVKLAYITNESARKATFKKRKSGLMKKVWELSELCGIDACLIILNPYDSQFEVSPSPDGVRRMLENFENMPEMEQTKKMLTQESFLRERIIKAREQLSKKNKENRDMNMTDLMFQFIHTGAGPLLQCSDMAFLNRLEWMIDNNLKEIRNTALEPSDNNVNGTAAQVAPISTPTPPQLPAPATATAPGSILTNPYTQVRQLLVDQRTMTLDFGMNMQNRQWPMDMLNAHGQAGTFGMNMQNRQWPVNMLNAQGQAGTSTGTGMNMQTRQWPMDMLNTPGQAGTFGMNMQNRQWSMDMRNAQGQAGTFGMSMQNRQWSMDMLNVQGQAGTSTGTGMNMQTRQWSMDMLNAQGQAGSSTGTGMNMQTRQWAMDMLHAQGQAGTSTGTGMNMQTRQWPMDMLNAQGQAGTSTGTGMNMQTRQWAMDMLNAQGQAGSSTGTGTGTETWLPPGEDMVLPLEQNQPNASWSNKGYYPR